MQKGITDKLLPQLERLILGKLEVSISRQLQTQFQTVGKQALQVSLFHQFTCTWPVSCVGAIAPCSCCKPLVATLS